MTLRKRIVACLDVTDGRVVKGTRFVDLVDAGDPVELAARYAAEGADEITILDIGATRDGRPSLVALIGRAAAALDVPLGVGGGVASLEDAAALLDAGADKVAVNSAALRDPSLIERLARAARVAVGGRRHRRRGASGRRMAGARRGRHRGDRPRCRRLGARGGRARSRRAAAHQHRPRRHALRLRPGAHARGGRCRPRAGDRVGRWRIGRRRGRRARPPAAHRRRCWRRRSTSGSCASARSRTELAARGISVAAGPRARLGRGGGGMDWLSDAGRTGRRATAAGGRRPMRPTARSSCWPGRIAEALAATEATGEAHFWSRSRDELWRKGATSGNLLHVTGHRGRLRRRCDRLPRPTRRPGLPHRRRAPASTAPIGSPRGPWSGVIASAARPIPRRPTRPGCWPADRDGRPRRSPRRRASCRRRRWPGPTTRSSPRRRTSSTTRSCCSARGASASRPSRPSSDGATRSGLVRIVVRLRGAVAAISTSGVGWEGCPRSHPSVRA